MSEPELSSQRENVLKELESALQYINHVRSNARFAGVLPQSAPEGMNLHHLNNGLIYSDQMDVLFSVLEDHYVWKKAFNVTADNLKFSVVCYVEQSKKNLNMWHVDDCALTTQIQFGTLDEVWRQWINRRFKENDIQGFLIGLSDYVAKAKERKKAIVHELASVKNLSHKGIEGNPTKHVIDILTEEQEVFCTLAWNIVPDLENRISNCKMAHDIFMESCKEDIFQQNPQFFEGAKNILEKQGTTDASKVVSLMAQLAF